MTYAIETHDLTKTYKDLTAVDRLNLTVQEGELYSLLGVNGAGKTTTIKMLSTLTKPSSGEAFVYGHSLSTEAPAIKELLAVSPQETAVAPNLSVQENLELFCGVHGFTRAHTKERTEELLDSLGLTSVRNKKASKLSGGWQRRLSIGMALVVEPKLLFLDEPTLGLDVIARSDLWDLIRSLKGTMTIVLTTHYMEEAESLSDHIGIMKEGHLLVNDTVEGIKALAGETSFESAFVKIVKEGIRS